MKWKQKSTLHEIVLSETLIPPANNKVQSIVERTIEIENIAKPRVKKLIKPKVYKSEVFRLTEHPIALVEARAGFLPC